MSDHIHTSTCHQRGNVQKLEDNNKSNTKSEPISEGKDEKAGPSIENKGKYKALMPIDADVDWL